MSVRRGNSSCPLSLRYSQDSGLNGSQLSQNVELSQVNTQYLFSQHTPPQNEQNNNYTTSMFDKWSGKRSFSKSSLRENSTTGGLSMPPWTDGANGRGERGISSSQQSTYGLPKDATDSTTERELLELVQNGFNESKVEMKTLDVNVRNTIQMIGNFSKNYETLSSLVQDLQKAIPIEKDLKSQLAVKECQITSLETKLKALEEEKCAMSKEPSKFTGEEIIEEMKNGFSILEKRIEEITNQIQHQEEEAHKQRNKFESLNKVCTDNGQDILKAIKKSESRMGENKKEHSQQLKDIIVQQKNMAKEIAVVSRLSNKMIYHKDEHSMELKDIIDHQREMDRQLETLSQSLKSDYKAIMRDSKNEDSQLKDIVMKQQEMTKLLEIISQASKPMTHYYQQQTISQLVQTSPFLEKPIPPITVNKDIVDKSCNRQGQVCSYPANSIKEGSSYNPKNQYFHNVDSRVSNISMPIINQTNIYPVNPPSERYKTALSMFQKNNNHNGQNHSLMTSGKLQRDEMQTSTSYDNRKPFISPFKTPMNSLYHKNKPSPVATIKPQRHFDNEYSTEKQNGVACDKFQKKAILEIEQPSKEQPNDPICVEENRYYLRKRPKLSYVYQTPLRWQEQIIPCSTIRRNTVRKSKCIMSNEVPKTKSPKKFDSSVYDFDDDVPNSPEIKKKIQTDMSSVSTPTLKIDCVWLDSTSAMRKKRAINGIPESVQKGKDAMTFDELF